MGAEQEPAMFDSRSVVPVAVLACWCVVPLAGQQPSSLDRPIQGDVRVADPRALHSCSSGLAVDHLARAAHVFVGFENTPDCPPSPRSRRPDENSETLTGLTVRQAFDHLIGLMPEFSWKE